MEDAKQIMIPTRSKAKISHLLSFPIGAERISKALADTPQMAKLYLHFHSDRWGHVRSGRYPCVRVQQSSRRAEMAERFADSAGVPLFNEWEVSVYPVPKIHRHGIQQNIMNVALPQINEWLRMRAELQQPGEQSLTFFFDERKSEFTSESEMQLHPVRA
ncbi:MAG TPA: hypothetical protein VHX60_13470 [Acidobacteriaceae bacterium]|jgi:hypothetical protein|nr:hypothetical protein [Acidobacteriaceae bacterium]